MSGIAQDNTSTSLFTVNDPAAGSNPVTDVLIHPSHQASVASELIATARALVYPKGKGIYATDESPDVMASILEAALGNEAKGKTWTEDENKERRKKWRESVYRSVPSDYISGVILYTETLLDFNLAPILIAKGIIPGVRANGELRSIPHSPSEYIVQGLDDLLPKLQAARAAGARFSKWRVPIACTSVETTNLPTQLSLEIQAETLAQYAAISQQAGLVPIIEPDVEFSASADLFRSTEVHERAITLIFDRLKKHEVLLEGILIKPSFPQPGLQHPSRANVTPEDIALATATTIARSVPTSVPGVVFLSGGLPPSTATQYLAALNSLVNSAPKESPFARLPPLSFSYGRALQGEAMKHWVRGDESAMGSTLQKWAKECWLSAQGVLTN